MYLKYLYISFLLILTLKSAETSQSPQKKLNELIDGINRIIECKYFTKYLENNLYVKFIKLFILAEKSKSSKLSRDIKYYMTNIFWNNTARAGDEYAKELRDVQEENIMSFFLNLFKKPEFLDNFEKDELEQIDLWLADYEASNEGKRQDSAE